jgi:rhamnosyltransferase
VSGIGRAAYAAHLERRGSSEVAARSCSEVKRVSSVSLIVPTLNAARHLEPLHRALGSQTSAPDEVLIIDSSSEDDTVERARRYGWRTYVIPREEFDHGGTRNLAVRMSTGEFLVFLSQDATPADELWLQELLEPLRADTTVGATFSRQIARPSATARERFSRLMNYPPSSRASTSPKSGRVGVRTYFLSNVSSATTRRAFEEAGGFPTRVILNEDGYYATRLLERGFTVVYAASSHVLHSHDYTIPVQFSRYFDIGVSHVRGPLALRSSRTTGTGMRFALQQIWYLVRLAAWRDVWASVLESLAKFVGYRLGRLHGFLPYRLRVALSWNKRYWNSVDGRTSE